MFNKTKCFYCNSWTTRPKNVKGRLRQFQCQHCTAVNYLDNAGRITDPPTEDVLPSTPQAPRYAHARSSSLNSRPSPSKVFCNTCLTNQHFLYENLRELDAVAQDEDSRKWHEQQLYIQGLEERYPQVCAQCRPRARDAIKRANYFTRTWNMMISMRKTKGGEYAPVVQGRWWRDGLLRYGQIGREASVLGQAGWHLLGARILVVDDSEPNLGTEQPNAESIFGKVVSCAAQTVASDGVNPHCFTDITPWMFWIIILGVSTIWWNNKLRQKYLDRKPGRMKGTGDYYMLQLLTLAIRGFAYYFLQNPHRLASNSGIGHLSSSKNIYRGAHIFFVAFLGFTELISRTLVQLNNRYQVRQLRDEDILPDTPMPTRATQASQVLNTAHSDSVSNANPPTWLRKQPRAFDISSLSSSLDARPTRSIEQSPSFPPPQFQSPRAPPTPPLEYSMEWSPTEASFASSSFESKNAQNGTYNLRPRNTPQKIQSSGPSPFAQLPPHAPPSRMTHPRALNGTTTSSHRPIGTAPASPVPSRSFTTNPSWDADSNESEHPAAKMPHHQAETLWSKHGPKKSDFTMAPPKFFLDQERIDTGLEGIFDEVFTLGSDQTPTAPGMKDNDSLNMRREKSEEDSPGRGHGAMFGDRYAEPTGVQPKKKEGMDVGVLVVMVLPLLILGMAVAVVRGWVDWRVWGIGGDIKAFERLEEL